MTRRGPIMPNGQSRYVFRLPWRSSRHIGVDVDDELRFHLDMRAQELMAAGMNEADARREATREFGDVEFTRRYCRTLDERGERATRRGDWLADAAHDVTQAVRVLRRSPGFLLIALVTIALGVGANSAIFNVIRGVLLRPLPFADPDRLIAVYEDNRPDHSPRSQLAAGDYVDYRRDQSSLTDIGVVSYADLSYEGNGDPVSLRGLRFSTNVFTILGVRPLLGRTFLPNEDEPGRNGVLVLSYATWQSVFGGDTTVVGRTVRMSGTPIQIIGVMPPRFTFGGQEQFWTPFVLQPLLADVNRARKFHNMVGIARLRAGTTAERAESDLLAIAHRNEVAHRGIQPWPSRDGRAPALGTRRRRARSAARPRRGRRVRSAHRLRESWESRLHAHAWPAARDRGASSVRRWTRPTRQAAPDGES
ncbi:MAG TPA: ABC transporter permease, partial [Gemmatimonadaceae bacterium]|nr:ABC transporter permease [Gemmatimonadaceae bacterium]